MADTEIEEIVDQEGLVRRLGSLLPQQGFVSSFNTFEEEHPVWDDAQILRVIKDPNRTPRRVLFLVYWILNQLSHGSCNGFAGAGALQKARYLRGILDKLLLSGAFVYSKINGGRDNGSALEDGLKTIQIDGTCPQVLVPWNMIYPNQQPKTAVAEAKKHRGLAAYAVQTKQGFRTALAAGFPVIVAVHAGRNFQTLNSQGIAGADNGQGNHAIHCDDICIINGKEVYDAVNSWGANYGTEGRAYLTWDSFEQTFGRHTFYAIASTEESEI